MSNRETPIIAIPHMGLPQVWWVDHACIAAWRAGDHDSDAGMHDMHICLTSRDEALAWRWHGAGPSLRRLIDEAAARRGVTSYRPATYTPPAVVAGGVKC